MNPNNYTSLEISRKLADAGIVMETEMVWGEFENCFGEYEWGIFDKDTKHLHRTVPAPSMSELWRELPEGTIIGKNSSESYCTLPGSGSPMQTRTNPCDALADLLVWVRKEDAEIKEALKQYKLKNIDS